MIIKVLGSGCASCKKLYENTQEAVKELGAEAQVLYVTDMSEIVKAGLMSTPGLIIDEKIVATGRVLKTKEIVCLIQKAI